LDKTKITPTNEMIRPTILIVDDEPSNCLILERVLGKLECDVIVTSNGWDAISLAKEKCFALILLDIMMPGINGYETLVRIKSGTINKDTPVFFMTGMETDQELLVKAYNAGAVDFIQKPMNLNILQRKTKYFLEFYNQKEELRLAQVKSEQLMKSRMALVANITHELRTPLFAMLGMIDVLKKDCEGTAQCDLVQKVGVNSENLLDTVNEFLDFSKSEISGNLVENEYFSLKKMCEDILNIMNYQYHKSKNVDLALVYDNEIPEFVRADKKKIRHILLNLFSNSLKFTKEGSVKLEIRNIGLKYGKPIVKFILEDTGVGIPQNKLQVIFEEYGQVANKYQGQAIGTGLGLTICNRLVNVLGGKLTVHSEEGSGTKFSFSIPIESGSESDIQEIKESYSLDELLGDHEISILIADDVPDNLFVLKNYLNTPKIHLDLTDDSTDAISKLNKNNYDIALLDINMPKKDGYQVAQEYNKYFDLNKLEGKRTTLVALTAFGMSDELEANLKKSLIPHYIMKPVRKEHLYQKIVSIVHNLNNDGFTKIAAFKDDSEVRDFDFDLLDNDFREYLPIYIENKVKEVGELKTFLAGDNEAQASAVCHKILGTAKSFGLFKVDREIEEVQVCIKDNYFENKNKILILVESSYEHLLVLQEMFTS
jgi:signal transduction histidine kinase